MRLIIIDNNRDDNNFKLEFKEVKYLFIDGNN